MHTAKKIEEKENMLVNQYAILVKRIAHHLLAKLPYSVQLDDLLQAGMIGLIEASRNYDERKGASFETYAGIRIRGAMLDEIRRSDWTPRSVHRNTRRVSTAIRELEMEIGRDASDVEIAEKLNLPLEEYHRILLDTSNSKLFALEDLGMTDEVLADNMSEFSPGPLDDLQQNNFKERLAGLIANLPDRERLVLALYYDEDLNLREVGEVMGVSESRISQIHTQAMIRLQSKMKDWE